MSPKWISIDGRGATTIGLCFLIFVVVHLLVVVMQSHVTHRDIGIDTLIGFGVLGAVVVLDLTCYYLLLRSISTRTSSKLVWWASSVVLGLLFMLWSGFAVNHSIYTFQVNNVLWLAESSRFVSAFGNNAYSVGIFVCFLLSMPIMVLRSAASNHSVKRTPDGAAYLKR